nr:MAG TPA: hypothetical protein [Caudoviricetes sp.]
MQSCGVFVESTYGFCSQRSFNLFSERFTRSPRLLTTT